MHKIIFGIFAHPDDEAFMTAGTLLSETRAGSELHLITLTNGDGGANPDNHPDLGAVRLEEWQKAGKLLGATGMYHLGFTDGKLSNTDMLEAADKIQEIATNVASQLAEPLEIEFMAFDLNGVTGHIDHIVASRAASLAFYKMKAQDNRFKRLRLACLPRESQPNINIDWLYMEPGRTSEEINEIVDSRPLKNEIIEVMRTHHSQRVDCESAIKSQGDSLGLNYFIVRN
jgi:LmbE family N-acetylglucosaminyl deacetylase